MTPAVEVAILGPSSGYTMGTSRIQSPDFAEFGPGIPWESRPRVTIPVDEGTTVEEVVDPAAEHFGIAVPLGDPRGPIPVTAAIDGVAFWKDGDDNPYAYPGPFWSYFTGLDENGHAVWGDASRARIADIRRAASAGVLHLDPARIYLAPAEPQGGELFIGFWNALFENFDETYAAVEAFLNLFGTWELGKKIGERLEHRAALRALASGMEKRLGGPVQLRDLLMSKPWTPVDLAQALDTTPELVDDVAAVAGLASAGPNSALKANPDADAEFARRLFNGLIEDSASSLAGLDTVLAGSLDSVTTELLQRTMENGRVPPPAAWGEVWHRRWEDDGQAEPGPATSGTEHEAYDFELGPATVTYHVVVADTTEGLDPRALEDVLNEAGASGLALEKVWKNQKLVHGRKAHVLILSGTSFEAPAADDDGPATKDPG